MTSNVSQLAIAYRPTKFEEVVGHQLSVRALEGMVQSENLPTGLLFSGASGTGKTTLARIVASALNADVIEVDAASNGGVAEMRNLIEILKYSGGGDYRVLILDEAQSLTRDAFNAILKTLEEPPKDVLFIFTTTDPKKIPITVRTRLVEFTFNKLSPSDLLVRMVQVVRAEGISITADLLKKIAQESDGSARKALTTLGLIASSGITTTEELQAVSSDEDMSVEVIQKMLDNDISGMYSVVHEWMTKTSIPSSMIDSVVSTLRDLMIIRTGSGSKLDIKNYEDKNSLSMRLIPEKIFVMLRILWDLKTQVKSRGDSLSDVELSLALMFEIVNRGK